MAALGLSETPSRDFAKIFTKTFRAIIANKDARFLNRASILLFIISYQTGDWFQVVVKSFHSCERRTQHCNEQQLRLRNCRKATKTLRGYASSSPTSTPNLPAPRR